MTRLLKLIYILAILPLLIGSATFFYWYYKRTWYASNADIELFAFFTILGFLLFAVLTLLLCTFFIYKNQTSWKKIIIPILIIVLTFPLIDLYGTLHNSLLDKAYVRIINDSKDLEIDRIWSENFEMRYFKKNKDDIIISFYPVYNYDWTQMISSDWYHYDINPVFIDLKITNDSIRTYELNEFSKGDCKTITLTDVINKHK